MQAAATVPDPDDDGPEIALFRKQKTIYPRWVKGVFRRRKWWLMALCLSIYYFAPFLRCDRGPHAPDQAILIDMAGRRGYWFFIEIWPQEVYYLTAILIFAAVILFFATSLLGRVWCGYFCFQTVWTDLFRWVEYVVQGDSAERKRLDEGPWTLTKTRKKLVTHLGWLAISLLTGGAFVLYFNDAPTLIHNLVNGHISSTVAMFVLGLTFSTYLMAGFAREQVCTFMCPYARFQSSMFDKDSLVIAYDYRRGEPRGKHKRGDSWDGRGHCIDCTQCVQVCPMGIDIRNGLQIECIACGLCIDACDSVMEKIGLPKGLVRYDTSRNLQRQLPPGTCVPAARLQFFRIRSFWYIGILSLVGILVVYGLVTRTKLDLHVLHDRNPLFVRLSDGSIRNGYEIHLLNKTLQPQAYALEISGVAGAVLSLGGIEGMTADHLEVAPSSVGKFRVFVAAPAQDKPQVDIAFSAKDTDSEVTARHDSMFISREGGNRE